MAPKNMPSTDSDGVYQFPYMKPTKTTRLVALRNSIYNPDTNAFFGRTPCNWLALVCFYTIFFSALAALFAICMYGLLASVNDNEPTYKLGNSLIGTNPGLGYRPFLPDVDRTGSLIWYRAADAGDVQIWTSILDDFLEDYEEEKKRKSGENRVVCSFDHPPPAGKVCDVPLNDFGPCSKETGYSFNQSSPCVFIKLNRIFNWVPEYFNETADLPKDMDDDLKAAIQATSPTERNVVWVSCYGENVHDRENIGPISYYPIRGFRGFYYPYQNYPGYLSPLVAVQFHRPASQVLINVECRAWAKNVEYRRVLQHREGSVHFELLID